VLQKPVYSFAPISFHFRLARLKGRLECVRSRSRGRLAETLGRHLDGAVDKPRLHRIVESNYEFRQTNDFARLWPQTRGFAGAHEVEIEGLDHLDRALDQGNGAILITAHFGFARLIKPVLRAHGRRALLVGHPRRPGAPDITPLFSPVGSFVHTRLLRLPRASRYDERWNTTVGEDLWAGLDVRPHVAALARNETLIILADGRTSRYLHPVPVLGIDVPLAPGAINLARNSGAAALPSFVVDDPDRLGPKSFRLVIHPPLDLQITRNRRADLDVNLRRFAAVYEEQIQANPHNFHWTWVRDGVLEWPHHRAPARAGDDRTRPSR
jgi:lauroyl/myristoyl acyltransferase